MVAAPFDNQSRLYMSRYSYAEADRLARVSRGTAKRWLEGYPYRSSDGTKKFSEPVTERSRTEGGGVSFVDLVEIAAIDRWKALGYSVIRIKEIVRECQEIFETERPLITHRFRADGKHAFVEMHDGVLVGLLGAKRQEAWAEIFDFLSTVEYEGQIVVRWWPLGKEAPVVVDPDFGFGLPVIAGIGLRTEIVLERVTAGESETEIAEDFRLPVESVARAIQFEVSRLRAP